MSNGVEFLLDLQSKLDGATSMLKALTDVEKAALKGDQAMKKLEKQSSSFKGAAGWFKDIGAEAKSNFTDMFAANAVWDTLKGGIHKAIEVSRDLVKEMVTGAAEGQRMGQVFENLVGADGAKEIDEALEKIAARSEFTADNLEGFAVPLLDAGIKGKQLYDVIAGVADVAARSEDKMAGASEAVSAFSKVGMTGILDKRTLRALKLNSDEFFTSMAANVGTSTETLKKKLQEGKIATATVMNEVLVALEKKGGGVLGGAAAGMSKGLSTALMRVKDIPNKFSDALKDSQGANALTDGLNKIWESLDPNSPEGQTMVNGINDMMSSVGDALKSVDWKSVTNELAETARGIGAMIQPMMDLARVTRDVASAFSDFMGFTWIGNVLGELFGKNAVEGMTDGILAERFEIDQSGQMVGRTFRKGTARELKIQSPSKVYEEFGRQTIAGFTQGVDATRQGAADNLNNVLAPPSASSGAGGGRGAAVGNITMPITVNVAGTNSSPDEIGRAVRTQVSTELLAILEQLGLQAGTSLAAEAS